MPISVGDKVLIDRTRGKILVGSVATSGDSVTAGDGLTLDAGEMSVNFDPNPESGTSTVVPRFDDPRFGSTAPVTSVNEQTGDVVLDASDVGLGNVDNTSDANKPVSTATQTALNLKAPLASPALTGTPTAPTAAQTVNNTQVATTAYVRTAVDAVPAATAATATADGAQGLAVYAADNASASARDLAVTPAMLANGVLHPVRITRVLTSPLTIYVAPSSIGTGDGSSAANAMELQAAIDQLREWNINKQDVNFQLQPGTYTKTYNLDRKWLLNDRIIAFNGDAANVGNVVFAPVSGACLVTYGKSARLKSGPITYLRNITFTGWTTYGIQVLGGDRVYVDQADNAIVFNMTGGTACFYIGDSSAVNFTGTADSYVNATVNGTNGVSTYFAYTEQHSFFYVRYVNFTFIGTPAFTSIVHRVVSNFLYWANVRVTGSVGPNTYKMSRDTAYGYMNPDNELIPGVRKPASNMPPYAIDPHNTKSNCVLRLGGVNTSPEWNKVELATDVSGILPVANGGNRVTVAAYINSTGVVSGISTGIVSVTVTSTGVFSVVVDVPNASQIFVVTPSYTISATGAIARVTYSGNTVTVATHTISATTGVMSPYSYGFFLLGIQRITQ